MIEHDKFAAVDRIGASLTPSFSEIYKDPSACAIKVLDFVTARMRNATGTKA